MKEEKIPEWFWKVVEERVKELPDNFHIVFIEGFL